MPVVILIAAVAILAAVVVVASGRGGEMARQRPDYAPPDLGPVTAADVAMLRPPSAAWGYNMRITDEALGHVARAMKERDIQIAALQQQVADLRESQRADPAHQAPRPQQPGVPRTVPEQTVQGWERADRNQADRDEWARRDQERQAQAGQARPEQGQVGQARPGQARSGQARTEQGQSGPRQAERGRPGWGQPGPARPGQGQEEGGRAGWDRAAEGPVLQGRVVPRHAAMRSPSGRAESPDHTWYGPAPEPEGPAGLSEPLGPQERGEWREGRHSE